jgi:hypothetical protein
MDRERLDLILDRQLRSALSVTPSADFTARLREGLARQPRPARFSWRLPLLACAMAASLAVALGIRLMPQAPPEVRTPVLSARPPLAATPGPLLPSGPAEPLPAKVPALVRRAKAVGASEPEFRVEVIVPPGQDEAIRRFARNLGAMSVSGRQPLRVIEIFEGELPQVPSYDVKGNER